MLNPQMALRKKMLDSEARNGPATKFRKKGEVPGGVPTDDSGELGTEFVQMMVTPEEKDMIMQARADKGGPEGPGGDGTGEMSPGIDPSQGM